MKNKRIKQIGIVVTLAILCAASAAGLHSCKKEDTKISTEVATEASGKKNTKMYTWSEKENTKTINDYEWIDQSTYDSKTDKNLSSELFAIPFAMSKTYVTNDRLTEVIGEKEEDKYVNNAREFLLAMFDHSFRDILSDQQGFKDTLDSYWYSDKHLVNEIGTEENTNKSNKDVVESTEEDTQAVSDASDELMQWYIDNKVILSCDVSTDNCLMFQDNYRYYVRAEIALTLHGGKKAAQGFKELYNMDLTEGKTSYYIVEIESIPSSPNKITAFSVIMKAKAK